MATALRGHANSIETPPPCPPKAVGMAPTFWPIADPDERLGRLLNANRFGGFTHADRPRDSPRRAAHADASQPSAPPAIIGPTNNRIFNQKIPAAAAQRASADAAKPR